MTSIDQVKALVGARGGLQLSNRYRIIMPTIIKDDDIITLDALCRSVSFPGKTFTDIERRVDQKIVRKAAGYATDPVNMTFTEVSDNMVTKYFDAWQESITSPIDYVTAYPDQYCRNIYIIRLDKEDNFQYGVLLKKAWPKQKNTITLSDESETSTTTVDIQFEYSDYEVVNQNLSGTTRSIIDKVRSQLIGLPLAALEDNLRDKVEEAVKSRLPKIPFLK